MSVELPPRLKKIQKETGPAAEKPPVTGGVEAPTKPKPTPRGGWGKVKRTPNVNPWGAHGNSEWWKIHSDPDAFPDWDDPPDDIKKRILTKEAADRRAAAEKKFKKLRTLKKHYKGKKDAR